MSRITRFPFHLWPLGAHLRAQRLHLGGLDLAEWAAAAGTPAYLYDAATCDHAIACYRYGLRAWPGPSLLAYAAKAWLNLPAAELFKRRGLGLDVVSQGELGMALAGGYDPARLHLHGNNKPPALLRAAIAEGVGAIVVDNLYELDLLEELASTRPEPLCLWLRLNPNLLAPTHRYRQTGHHGAKFGLSWDEAVLAARRIRRHTGLALTGLHTHIGSQIFDLDPILTAATRLVALAAALVDAGLEPIAALCPGGGLGQPYHPDDARFDLAEAVKRIASHCTQVWSQYNFGSVPTLVLEPGRSLVARAGIALYTVGAIRRLADGSRIIAVDGGMADNPRPALYEARYTACLPAAPLAPLAGPARIVGPLCESGDILIEDLHLPEVHPGAILAVPVSGAYQLSMASNYNATLLPPVYWRDGERLICLQRRQTTADLLLRDLPLPS